MPTGNAGMPTPYDQGVEAARRGQRWEQIYDQPDEEVEANNYRRGYFDTIDTLYLKLLNDNKGSK